MEEDKRNQELLIVGKAFLNTGITKVEQLIQDYIDTSIQYNDSYSVALLNYIKQDISKYLENENKALYTNSQPKETSIYIYSGTIIKIYDKTSQYGFCIKKDYINDKLVQIQGICLDFIKSQMIDIDETQCRQIEELYNEFNNKSYQLAIKEFRNRDYGNILYDNIKDKFLIIKREEVPER